MGYFLLNKVIYNLQKLQCNTHMRSYVLINETHIFIGQNKFMNE